MERIEVKYTANSRANSTVKGSRWLDPNTGKLYVSPSSTCQVIDDTLFPVAGEPGLWRSEDNEVRRQSWAPVATADVGVAAPADPVVGGGQKFDGDKDEPGLLLSGCHLAVAGIIKVLGFGFRKYKQRNGWKSVPEAGRRYKDALHRHLAAIERGEIFDNEPGGSGLPHIDHVACNAVFLSQMHHEATAKGVPQP